MIYDLIIVGCGPAGMSAAIYAKKSNLNVLVLEKEAPGGKLLHLDKVNNYLGFNNVSGTDLAINMFDHFNSFEILLEMCKVEEIVKKDNFIIKTQDNEYTCKSVILATGLNNPRKLFNGEKQFIQKGISYCAVCDGSLYKNKTVAYIGENDIQRDLNYLSNLCSKIIYIGKTEHIKNEKIIDINTYNSIEFYGESVLKGIKIDEINYEVDGVFIESSMNASNVIVKELSKDENFIIVDETMKTNIEGLFAAGDNNKKVLRQISTAINDGAIAATSALNYIKNRS